MRQGKDREKKKKKSLWASRVFSYHLEVLVKSESKAAFNLGGCYRYGCPKNSNQDCHYGNRSVPDHFVCRFHR